MEIKEILHKSPSKYRLEMVTACYGELMPAGALPPLTPLSLVCGKGIFINVKKVGHTQNIGV